MEVLAKQAQNETILLYEDGVPDVHFSRLMSRFVSLTAYNKI